MSNPYSFSRRIVLVLVAIIALVYFGRMLMLPDTWGQYGYYRGAYINEEASRKMVYGTNESCKSCHSEVYELKSHSVHKRLSCELCHAPIGEHVKNGKKIADMPIISKKGLVKQCLKCHQKIIGRPSKMPQIEYKEHLEEKGVKLTHTCDQCHTVHAPMENIKETKRLRALKGEL